MRHHDVDIQWGNHDVVWMGAAAGSPICICTVLKTTLSYHNHGMVRTATASTSATCSGWPSSSMATTT